MRNGRRAAALFGRKPGKFCRVQPPGSKPVILKFAAAALAPCIALALAGAAHAAPCGAPSPAVGTVVHGPVLQVIDAEHLCVALGPDQSDWTEFVIRGGDQGPLYRPDRLGPALLMSVAFARTADCVVNLDAKGRKVADCRIDGRPLSELMADPGAVEAAAAWVRKTDPAGAPIQLASR